jgi:hypothetical protein
VRAPPVWYERAEQLRRENHTLQKISDLLGIPLPTIRTQLIQRMDSYDDFIQPTRGNEVAERTCRIQKALAQGGHPPLIAKEERVSRQWVYVLRKRNEGK